MEKQEPFKSPPRLSLGTGGGDRLKRDEWSEGAVGCLLEAYESKWVLRNRAKLKGQDWEDVAREVSSGAAGSAKTATQCKNKIESMKKRYRNEVAAGTGSRWPLFPKLDGLVRCRGSTMPAAALVVVDEKPAAASSDPAQAGGGGGGGGGGGALTSQSAEHNGVAAAAAAAQENHTGGERLQPTEMNKESDQNAPSCHSSKENQETRKKEKRKRAKEEGRAVVESIQWFAEVILRVEQARMEAMRGVEKIRAEAEARKGEMDLKRTEIIANTQLQIAKLLARSSDKGLSSPRIGRD